VIRGSAINNDGSLKAGLTAPSIPGQAEAIAMAIAASGVAADSITCLEAHGTGTPLGDPVEVAALNRVFRSQSKREHYCAMGSVKTNIGHLEAAAGIAGLIKTVLAMEHRQIPPSLFFENPNPGIDFEHSPFFVNTELRPWDAGPLPLRAGVSSFGLGGTNAHVVVEEAPRRESSDSQCHSWQLLPLSAKTPEALARLKSDLAQHLRNHVNAPLADVAHTLQVGRRAFAVRAAVVCRDRDEAIALLEQGDAIPAEERATQPVRFVFPAPQEELVTAGRDLYQQEPDFRALWDECMADAGDAGASPLAAGFLTQFVLAQLLTKRGVVADSASGEGVGRYAAACLTAKLPLAEALASLLMGDDVACPVPAANSPAIELVFGAATPGSIALVKRPGIECAPQAIWRAIADLWVRGAEVNWDAMHTSHRHLRTGLPGYPFERARHWIDPAPRQMAGATEPVAVRRRAPEASPFTLHLMEQQLEVISQQLNSLRSGTRANSAN
jgi:acyl transferase domain-containing protein